MPEDRKGVLVYHGAHGHFIGTFDATEDHGGVDVKCPQCGEWVYIHNAALIESLTNKSKRAYNPTIFATRRNRAGNKGS